MEKLGFGPGRKELQETVETQRKQLLQYQSRFKDVVRAYKSLLKEKEALEASLTVLSVSQQDPHGAGGPPPSGPPQEDGCSLHSEDSLDTAASVEESEDQPGEPAAALQSDLDAGGSDSSRLGGGASARSAEEPADDANHALATVTQEKSRMEASFQADKRQLKQEVEEQEAELHTLQMHKDVELHALQLQQEAELHGLQLQLAESRARIITQQHERQQEQDDHALQLRELQRILQQERDMRQDAELRLQEGAESQSHLQQMRDDRDELSKKLQAAEDERRKPDPRAEQLQRELTQLKTRIQDQISAESRKACEAEQRSCEAEQRSCEAEQRSRDRAQAAEDRVSVLELRVSELSELLGSSEKQRQREQHAAQRLREEVLQLEAENKTLAIRTEGRTEGRSEGEEQLDVVALKEKLEKVKKLLQQRNPEQEVLPDQAAAHYQQELRALRDEFERYKLRAQLVLKNKNTKDGCQAKELEEVRDQLSELKEKYINLRIHSDEAEAVQRRMLEERQQLAAALQLQHRQEAEQAAALHREQLLRLEAELHKQRGRTMQLLKEKEQELEALRAAAPAPPQEPDSDALSVALRRAAPSEPTLLLAARRGGAALRGRVDKLQRDQSREGANMEYLKNVTYKFLTLQDASGRMQTLNAILTILSFSPQEKSCVTKLQRSAWWR
ncbi:GRIP and coiled-coil domain containing protein 1 [Dissostichus eleginoides]|uniref:GRIP and coiled-coil domain containing protein 1 n=1 Tax=Dissostichus eleginoides TaxID=100907 RepID=A0AAD9ER99_DISEL|nr:GRIP and coiled-coil domain containing protein 1 [Dissostichus eleginoides]